MCGLAGAVGFDPAQARSAVAKMCEYMAPRGPDDSGLELLGGSHGPAVLGARRLAIIDPSPAGHQPMTDSARQTTVVFNGIIYNHAELRAELEATGERFSSRCDTEVVLKAYGQYGTGFVHHLRGMFALAVWDGSTGELLLLRDRLGIKPLYYSHEAGRILFASQVKALLASGLVSRQLSPAGLQTYLSFGAVSEPLTAIDGVFALPAAHFAVIRDGEMLLTRYWNPPIAPADGLHIEDAAKELRALLDETVACHLVSDAPLGVFLSGGLDSSTLAAFASPQVTRLQTVSIEFDDPSFSEESYVRLASAHARSDHLSLTLRPEQLLGQLPEAFGAMDQPSFDGLNTFAVARAAAGAGLKVALSGLGADELFDGYGYFRRVRMLESLRRLPKAIARLAPLLGAVTGTRRDKLESWLAQPQRPGSSYELLRRVFLARDIERLAPGRSGPPLIPPPIDLDRDIYAQISLLDLTNYTLNVLLRDTDAMSMANSLEVRVPYLDHRLVEWALCLPGKTKGARKALLAEVASDLLPREIVNRRKHGFVLPFGHWLRGPLRPEAEKTLRSPPQSLCQLLSSAAVANVWGDFLGGRRGWTEAWSLFALCKWADSLTTG